MGCESPVPTRQSPAFKPVGLSIPDNGVDIKNKKKEPTTRHKQSTALHILFE